MAMAWQAVYELLKATVDPKTGLPQIKSLADWKNILSNYEKADVNLGFLNLVRDNKARLPYPYYEEQDIRNLFLDLASNDTSDLIITNEERKESVREKFDYKYGYNNGHGLGVLQFNKTYNAVSNYFHVDLRMDCPGYNLRSPMDLWNDDKAFHRIISPLFRMSLYPAFPMYGSMINLGTYVASQFKPNVAKFIYDDFAGESVLDTSCGWGDRLAGFWASGAKRYVGCDPNPKTFERYKLQCQKYAAWLGQEPVKVIDKNGYYHFQTARKSVTIYNAGAEIASWEALAPFDIYFTSPPYFSTERYNKGGEKEAEQSWAKFSTYESWRDDFFYQILERAWDSMSPNGHVIMNIIDPVIKEKRYELCDEMVERYKKYFVGQVGMRMMTRPKDIDSLAEFQKAYFIEPMWVFSKGEKYKFGGNTRSTLEGLFA
jgi:hypothetical protein